MRRMLGFVSVLLLLTLAGPAAPRGRDDAGSMGVLGAANPVARTVQIDGRVYRVTDRTVLENRSGDRIRLETLRPGRGAQRVYVLYRAASGGGTPELKSLRLSDAPQ